MIGQHLNVLVLWLFMWGMFLGGMMRGEFHVGPGHLYNRVPCGESRGVVCIGIYVHWWTPDTSRRSPRAWVY